VKEAQYADIKLYVVIKGRHNSIIGEVQFLLRAMKDYKDKAHNLYAIQRREEMMKESVSKILPFQLNEEKKILREGCRGKVKQICSLMILQNKKINDLMFVDKASGNNILHRVCTLGHVRLFLFLESMMSPKQFIEHIFVSDISDVNAMEYAITNSNVTIVEHLVSMKEVQQHYQNNDELIFRLCYNLFVLNSDHNLTESVLSALQISKDKVREMLSYKCPKQAAFDSNDDAVAYHKFNILVRVCYWGTMAHLQRFIAFVGEQAFIDNVFNLDGWNFDLMNSALMSKRMKVIEYVLSFEQIRNKYLTDRTLMLRLISSLNQDAVIKETEIVKYVVDNIGLTKDKLKEFKFRDAEIEKICSAYL